MAGLIGPLADWFEMASLGSSPWGAPLSFFWFPLFTNSKQKSISFSRGFGRRGEISRPRGSASQEVTLKGSSFLPSSSKFLNGWLNSFGFPFSPPSRSLRHRACLLGLRGVIVRKASLAGQEREGTCWECWQAELRSSVSLILKHQRCHHVAALKSVWCWSPRPGSLGADSPLPRSLMKDPPAALYHWLSLFFCPLIIILFFWKGSLTNYDSWLEKL